MSSSRGRRGSKVTFAEQETSVLEEEEEIILEEQEDDRDQQQHQQQTQYAEDDRKPAAKNTNLQQQQQLQSQTQQSQLQCPNCGGRNIEISTVDASGASVCTDCGVVVEENTIVSSVEFVEGNTGGGSTMVGQFVSATSSRAYTGGGGGGGGPGGRGHGAGGGHGVGFTRDSRETTLANGRRRIQELANRLRLGHLYVDGAHRLFTVAVEKNFVQGRRTTHVIAACLYIACRQEKSPHMLIDFSDALSVNVYTLGTTFLKFRRLLGLKLEIIDPALYIYRFAAHLDLDENLTQVSMTALRLVARMKRDWIVAGRRPAGICAAALLIAARAHGLNKSTTDVTRILRVCGLTVTKRVVEFENTPTAQLTLEQFHKNNNNDNNNDATDQFPESDPPIYQRNKKLEARAKAILDNDIPLLESGVLDDEGKRGSKWRKNNNASAQNKAKTARALQFQTLYSNLEKTLMKEGEEENDDDNDKNDTEEPSESLDDDKEPDTSEKEGDEGTDTAAATAAEEEAAATSKEMVVHQGTNVVSTNKKDIPADWKDAYPKARGRHIILPNEATAEEQQPPLAPTESKICLADWKDGGLPASIDQEIDDIFRTDEEEKQKEAIFVKINKDYIVQQERKENERRTAEAAAINQNEDDLAQAAGQARYKESRTRKRGRDAAAAADGAVVTTTAAAATTEEQLLAAVASRKVSRKINYDALSSLFDDDGSFATTDAGAPDDDDEAEMMFEMV